MLTATSNSCCKFHGNHSAISCRHAELTISRILTAPMSQSSLVTTSAWTFNILVVAATVRVVTEVAEVQVQSTGAAVVVECMWEYASQRAQMQQGSKTRNSCLAPTTTHRTNVPYVLLARSQSHTSPLLLVFVSYFRCRLNEMLTLNQLYSLSNHYKNATMQHI